MTFIKYLLFLLCLVSCTTHGKSQQDYVFNADAAYEHIKKQLSFGPRYPGSAGHQEQIDWINNQLLNLNWKVELQQFEYMNTRLTNIIAKKGDSNHPIIIGTHFDTRRYADGDPLLENKGKPVLGANDGASGVAVLLELARILKEEEGKSYWLTYFDGEDQGNIAGWDWIKGSSFFANSLDIVPKAVIIIDMIGDADLAIHQEGFSNQLIQDQIWQMALSLGFGDVFIPKIKYSIIDDHKPFVDLGIPSVLLIDLDYPYWHTVDDTLDKVSTLSLERVGLVLSKWLQSQ